MKKVNLIGPLQLVSYEIVNVTIRPFVQIWCLESIVTELGL